MSNASEAKLDILLAHHASLEAQLLGQVSSEDYVRITRELAELNPLIDAVKAYRAANAEIAGIDALIADPRPSPRCAPWRKPKRETLEARSVELAQQIRVALLPKDADGRSQRRAGKSAPAPAATRPRFSPATCFRIMSASPPCRAGRSR